MAVGVVAELCHGANTLKRLFRIAGQIDRIRASTDRKRTDQPEEGRQTRCVITAVAGRSQGTRGEEFTRKAQRCTVNQFGR